MKKDAMYELAKVGMRARLQEIESDLRDWYREFPDVFLVPPPQLVRPALRNGNGHHPLPAVGSLKAFHSDTKVAQLLPYLQEHGPTRQQELAKALGLKSSGSLSSALAKRIREGLITRVGRGLYAATSSATPTSTTPPAARRAHTGKRGKKTKKPKVDVKAQRARTARVLEIVASADGPMPGTTLSGLSGMPPNAFGSLIARGYLKSGKNGLTRTSKAFVV